VFRPASAFELIAALAISSDAAAQSTIPKCLPPFAMLVGDRVFARYAVTVASSKPVPPDVSKGLAHTYRTVIREQAKLGPNFAAHYTVIEIGCGAATSCVAIADANTGHVYFPPNVRSATALLWGTGKFDLKRLNYRPSSRLLIVAGEPNESEKRAGLSYYRWNGRDLVLVRFVPAATLCKGSTRI
jgi:hypothetical protein